MKQRKYLIIHCTATPEGREIDGIDITKMHIGPKNNANGTVTYKGKVYKKRSDLPKEFIGTTMVSKINGRGWKQVGYRKLVQVSGRIIDLVANNNDNIIDPWEITNGVSGINDVAEHIVYAGGVNATDVKKSQDTRTAAQKESLKKIVLEEISKDFDLLVGGHYHFAAKACPSFNVETWLQEIGVSEKNILRKNKI